MDIARGYYDQALYGSDLKDQKIARLEKEIERLRGERDRYKSVLLDIVNQYPEEDDVEDYWYWRAKSVLPLKESE